MASFLPCLSFSDCLITSTLNREKKEASPVGWRTPALCSGEGGGVRVAKAPGGKGGI